MSDLTIIDFKVAIINVFTKLKESMITASHHIEQLGEIGTFIHCW